MQAQEPSPRMVKRQSVPSTPALFFIPYSPLNHISSVDANYRSCLNPSLTSLPHYCSVTKLTTSRSTTQPSSAGQPITPKASLQRTSKWPPCATNSPRNLARSFLPTTQLPQPLRLPRQIQNQHQRHRPQRLGLISLHVLCLA